MYKKAAAFAAILAVVSPSAVHAITLREALTATLYSNPQIGQAVENREAIEFELRQARGLFLPSIDLDASTGAQRLDNESRRLTSIEDDDLYPRDVGITVSQKLFDGGARRAERDRQASRVDGASFRVLERSETLGLQVIREYIEIILQGEILGEARENLKFHQSIQADVSDLVAGGKLTDADRQQVDERLLASRVRSEQAAEDLEAAKIRFVTLVGRPIGNWAMPGSVVRSIPKTLDEAVALGRSNNPRIQAAIADISAAEASVNAARAEYSPKVYVEGAARTGMEINGDDGRTTDYQVRLAARWNLYRGGIDSAAEQEQIRRASEARLAMHQAHREVEEAVRISWDRRARQAAQAVLLQQQSAENSRLVESYRSQLDLGQRSLLDVLDAQNTEYNVAILAKTARYAARFAEYRLLAATGILLKTMDLKPPQQSQGYPRAEYNVPPAQPTDIYRSVPSSQSSKPPIDLLVPVQKP
ncbi:TolC family protein [Flaviflagellibacter deserti]|uniref:TolC family protein n=1 Tax=Flaviflagellibacter deserti TaxID=2267266 RepID=A0ABV9Z787_9HYPH